VIHICQATGNVATERGEIMGNIPNLEIGGETFVHKRCDLINPSEHKVVIVCDGRTVKIYEDGKEHERVKHITFDGEAGETPTLDIEKYIK
jgi:hypothetical protein